VHEKRILRRPNSHISRKITLTDDLRDQLQTALGATYTLERELSGGMSRVFVAEDRRLRRRIVVKVLAESLVTELSVERFEREMVLAAGLQHPHIVPVLGAGTVRDLPYYTMPLVEGESLRSALAGASLSTADRLVILRDVAEALAYAHERGVVHRDIKPENVLLSGRAALVIDFGIAKALSVAAGREGAVVPASLTQAGISMGSPAYMAPEQAAGDPTTDHRADLYAWGMMAYELLSRRHPFADKLTAQALIAAHFVDVPTPLHGLAPGVPVAVSAVIMRCLEKNPLDRPSGAAQLIAAFTQPDAALPAPVVVATTMPGRSIVVLPFANLSGDKENDYFGDGLAEEIINALSTVPDLRVIARASAFAFRGKDHDRRAIGKQLGVETILEGSARRAGNRIRVTAQLIRVADESHIWSERYDREMTDVFAIQDDISQAITNALKVKFAVPQRRTGNVQAFQSYLKGLYWYQRYTPENLIRAKDSFEQAIELDPGYAPAYAGLAVFYFGVGALSIKRMTEMAPLAKAAAARALAIDQTLSEAHSVLGVVAGAVEYDWRSAERHFRDAMTVDPVPALVRLRYALYFLTPQRRFEEAVEQYRQALETDPLSMMVHFGLAFALYSQRRYDRAIEHAAGVVDLHPDHWLVHFVMGLAQSQKGALHQAIGSLETTSRLSPAFALASGFLAASYARGGEQRRADELMDEVRKRSSVQFVSPACFAIYDAAIGQADRMFEFLRVALADRDPYLTRMDSEPLFEPFRSDPRYHELLKRMNLHRPDNS
jgi:TolB-like protein/Tfp pilus assembly protein PilF